MTKRMLVDASHPEQTRVAIVDERRLEDFGFESAAKKQLKGNIYLAKVVRIEPSLQAAFVEYGGNRHGFLPFSEIHPDYFRIPMADRPHDAGDDDDADFIDEENDETEGSDDVEAYAEDVNDYEGDEGDHVEADHAHIEKPAASAQAEAQVAATLSAPAPEASAAPVASAEPVAPNFNDIAAPQIQMPEAPVMAQPVVKPVAPAPSEAVSGTPAAVEPSEMVPGLGPDAGQELGLITDFGNAAVGEVSFSPAPVPVETVGGEVAEEEQERVRVRHSRAPRYKIQEVVKRRQIMLIQVVKEERGNKGAALTTFLSLAGRYCVLMPNTDRGGGVSRKITSHQDRRRMKEILDQLETPEGMAVILRTAGMEQEPAEIQRDLEHLLRLWNNIREQTLASTAPTLIYEEANLIKRSIRDLYSADVGEILVAGQRGYELARDFMHSLMPDQVERVKLYQDPAPLFLRYNVEKQIDQLYDPVVQLRSGGYLVINPTEALVSIDVNSGRATRERHIESTALKTNLEAADEVARQLRLRDLAGLVVIDFIDMEDGRNNAAVERRMKEAMKADRARLQIGRISPFGLMELSRQRLHPSLTELNFERCPHCTGIGLVRSPESAAISALRVIEEEGTKQPGGEMTVYVPTRVALYVLNRKRAELHALEERYNLQVTLNGDDAIVPPECRIERTRAGGERTRAAVDNDQIFAEEEASTSGDEAGMSGAPEGERSERNNERGDRGDRNERGGRRRGRFGRNRNRDRGDRNERGERAGNEAAPQPGFEADGNVASADAMPADDIGNHIDAADDANEINGNTADASRESRSNDRFGERSGEQHQGEQRQGGRRRGRRGGRGRRRDGREGREGREGGGEQRRFDRAPREGNYNAPQPYAENASPAPTAAPSVNATPAYVPPMSVHDLDTTPRERPALSAPPVTPELPKPSVSVPYQVIGEAPSDDKPKGGWWRKLTGQ